MNQWAVAIFIAVSVLTGALLVFSLLEIYFVATDQEPIRMRLARWSGRYPLYAGTLLFVTAALLPHFFLGYSTGPGSGP